MRASVAVPPGMATLTVRGAHSCVRRVALP